MKASEIDAFLSTVKREDIVGIECKHAVYTVSSEDSRSDMVTVKELIHLKDGRSFPRLRFVKDYQRNFWLTTKPNQNHTDRKEWEQISKLKSYPTAQRNLNDSIVRAQGYGNPKGQLKILARNQYLFGADISTPALIKAGYQKRCPDLFTPNTVAVIDSETDMVNGDGKDPIILTITFKDKVYITIREDWIAGIAAPIEATQAALLKYLEDDIKNRGIVFEILITPSMAVMCKEVIMKAHEWQPDFVTFWNMDFDMTVMLQVLTADGCNLADLFSDPRVPPDYRYFNYKRGPNIKQKADGTIENLASYDQWHVVEHPASFQFIDAMCVYRQIRKAKGKAPSYSLDAILTKELKRGKLYFNDGESKAKPGSVEWHVDMQVNYKLQYIVYNVFDCLGVELLDEKTRDLQTQVSILSGYSEYSVFHSNPKRTSDKLHFFCLNIGKVVGCVNDKMSDENDKYISDLTGWIVTLPTHLVENNGLKMLEELPDVHSSVRKYVSDADITSTYPNGEIIMNLSKETTMMELGRIKGIDKDRQRLIGINLTGGPSNAIEILTEVVKVPTSIEMLELFKTHIDAA
jgi:hypothetical protein